MKNEMLLDRVTCSENLWAAFRECSRGKRQKKGYMQFLFAAGEKLALIQQALRQGVYQWQGYREFLVKDPKARLIMAAPFQDRVVHHALHRVIEPLFEPLFSQRTYACRKGKGSGRAVAELLSELQKLGPSRYTVKLDVENFFASIRHDILLQNLLRPLSDRSLDPLLQSLISSSARSGNTIQRGIPIGNLTSQLFANWMLAPVDEHIQIHHPDVIHFRYMDDIVIVSQIKKHALDCGHELVKLVRDKCDLRIPYQKFVTLADAPVPFLGYLLNHDGYKVLARNRRRFLKHIERLRCQGARPSRISKAIVSYEAWTIVPKDLKKELR